MNAISIARNGEIVFRHLDEPRLFMRAMSEREIADYLDAAGDEVLASVGAYQVEALGSRLFDRIDGDYFAVLGLSLLLINILLLILGTFMETIAIIIIVVPVLMPLVTNLGMDPIHFGVMVTVNLAIGANTPPVGVDLIAACKVGQTTLDEAWPYVWPFVAAMTVALAFVTFIPPLVTFLPHTFMR